jgi:hypothetical protein
MRSTRCARAALLFKDQSIHRADVAFYCGFRSCGGPYFLLTVLGPEFRQPEGVGKEGAMTRSE